MIILQIGRLNSLSRNFMHIGLSKNAARVKQLRCHNGKGAIIFREIFQNKDFKSSVEFLHETVILPKSTIGYHYHTGNEEIYYIISGKGLMNVDGEEKIVVTGDAVITHSGSSHGLKNIGKRNLIILVFEAKY